MSKNLLGLGITALILSVAPVSGQQLGTVEQARAMLPTGPTRRCQSAVSERSTGWLTRYVTPIDLRGYGPRQFAAA
jgi:hypothetical protein